MENKRAALPEQGGAESAPSQLPAHRAQEGGSVLTPRRTDTRVYPPQLRTICEGIPESERRPGNAETEYSVYGLLGPVGASRGGHAGGTCAMHGNRQKHTFREKPLHRHESYMWREPACKCI